MLHDKELLTRFDEQLKFAKFVRDNRRLFNISRSAAQILVCICAVSKKTSDQHDIDPFCFISNQAIADHCGGLSQSAVSRGLKALEIATLIERNLVGNGKRFVRNWDGKLLPAGSSISLVPLHDHIARRETYERASRDEAKALEARQDAARACRDALLCKAAGLHEELTDEQEKMRQSIENRRPSRLKGEGLSRLEADLIHFKQMIEQVGSCPLALKMTTCGSQSDDHKEPKTEYIFQSNNSIIEDSNSAVLQEKIAGFRLMDLQQMLPRAFDIPGIDKNNFQAVVEAQFQVMRLTPSNFGKLDSVRKDPELVLLVILYVAEMDPVRPKAYIETLGQKEKLGNFCVVNTLENRYRICRYRLKKIKAIKEGFGSDA